jgi:hypothetical protein
MSSSLITRRSRLSAGALRTGSAVFAGAAVRFLAAGAACFRATFRGAAFGAARLTALRATARVRGAAAFRTAFRAGLRTAFRTAFRLDAVFLAALAARRGAAFFAFVPVRPAVFRLPPAFVRPARAAFRLAINWSFRYRAGTGQLP